MAVISQNKMFILRAENEEKCTETQLDITHKINTGEYLLLKKKKRSTVWKVYREIVRPDGSKLKWRYYCLGCQRVMQSTGGTTSNLRIHKCHVRYLKQHNLSKSEQKSPKQQQINTSQQKTREIKNQITQITNLEEDHGEIFAEQLDLDYSDVEEIEQSLENANTTGTEFIEEAEQMSGNGERPLLKFFSEESWSHEMSEEQPIEMESIEKVTHSNDFKSETIKPSNVRPHIEPTALAEAESYAKSWAHAFLKLNDDQKFYAKRSIDELLVLGRLERLSISTVTSLTTNL